MRGDLCRATLTADDRLIDADESLVELNEAAGGTDRLVLPAVLTLARLARRLGVAISRPVVIADDEHDWHVWLRAVPGRDMVRLVLAEWVRRPHEPRRHPAPPPPTAEPLLGDDFGEPLRRALERPLSRIVATAESLRLAEGAIPDTYRDYARDIAEAGRHLQGLVGDLVELDQLERAQLVQREPIDLALVANRAAGLLGLRASERDVVVRVEAAPCRALGDERRALQIAVNLLSNALGHSDPGTQVVLATGYNAEEAWLSVADEGPGIAPTDQARIFDKFVRLAPGRAPGSGLGLYISRRLARAMGGELAVDSTPGSGARFTLTLPAA